LKTKLIIGIFILLCGCRYDNSKIAVHPSRQTLLERIQTPQGYEWIIEESGSFGEFLQNVQLQKAGSLIFDYKQKPIRNQFEHIAVLNYDIGDKDLQQCADAIIRLRAEYLFQQKRFDDIHFQFTNGDVFSWNDYKTGIRPQLISSSKVAFNKVAGEDDSYKSFRNYLDVVFMYAGTISLHNETTAVSDNNKIKTGDFLVTPGSPGHAVIIAGRAINKKGEIIFLLVQGYTPAQSIHVITNPYNGKINPWYKLDIHKHPTSTAGYEFQKTNIRTFKN
jgi:hypothetical protein